MVTDTRDQIGKPDNNAVLWTVLAIVVLGILGYSAYAAYYHTDAYNRNSVSSAAPNTTQTTSE